MSGSRGSPGRQASRPEYEQRVNRVIDHIRAHLGEALTLAELARVAAFTPREGHMRIAVRELPAYRVAYMRYVGPYGPQGIPELWGRLRQWMATRGLEVASTVRLGIGHDDAGIIDPAKCSYDACVVVPDDFAADRWVNLASVPPGRYAVASFHGTAHEIESAWARLYADWLPDSGYQPDDRPCIEIYRGAPETDAKAGTFRCDLCLPVRAL